MYEQDKSADMNVEDIKDTEQFSLIRHLDDKEISKIVNIPSSEHGKRSHVFFQDDY